MVILHRGQIEDVHEHSKESYVLRFYRIHRESHNCWDSFLTVFHLHNQTIDIWLHVYGAILFAFVAAQWLYTGVLAEMTLVCQGFAPYLFIGIYLLGNILCFAFSSIFHVASLLPAPLFLRFRTLDYTGVLAGSGMSGLLIVYFVFVDQPILQGLYCASTAMLFGLAVRGLWKTVSAGNTVLYWFYGFLMLGVTHHAIAAQEWVILRGVIITTSWYSVGLVFYLTKFPEKYFRGWFDLVGKSHQFWHLLTLIGAWRFYYDAAIPAVLNSGVCAISSS